MTDVKLQIDEADYKRILGFKKIYTAVSGEEITVEDFMLFVASKGMDSMVWDIIPQDTDVLKDTINAIKKENPEFFVEFMINTLKRGEVKEEAKKRIMQPYE